MTFRFDITLFSFFYLTCTNDYFKYTFVCVVCVSFIIVSFIFLLFVSVCYAVSVMDQSAVDSED